MIRWFFGFLAFLLLIRLVLRFVLGLLQGLTEPSGAAGGPRAARRGEVSSVALVRDPVCNTYIPRDGAVTALVGRETRYYCSDACRTKDAEARRFAPPPIGRAAHG